MFKRDLKTENLEPRILIFKYDERCDGIERKIGKKLFLSHLSRGKDAWDDHCPLTRMEIKKKNFSTIVLS